MIWPNRKEYVGEDVIEEYDWNNATKVYVNGKLTTESFDTLLARRKKENMTQEEFKLQYLGTFDVDTSTPINRCGDCLYFDLYCTTSRIEEKYGNAGTPACSEFKYRAPAQPDEPAS